MKLTDKQKDYMRNANKRWSIKVGATGTGKTFIDYLYTIPKRTRALRHLEGAYLIVGVTTSTIERNVLQPMRERYGEGLVGYIVKGTGTVQLFGETYHAIGAEKENATNKIQGMTVKYVYGDEFVNWNEKFFTMLTTRLRVEGAMADLTGNPSSPNHWAKKFIDEQMKHDTIYYQTSTIHDNPTLPKAFVKAQEIELVKGSARYQRYFLGQWANEEGQIYKSFNRNDHVIKQDNPMLKDITVIHIGIDFGGNLSKTTFQATGIIPTQEPKVITLHERRFEEERDSEYLKAQFIKFIEEVENLKLPIREIRADSAEQVLIRSLRKALAEARKPYKILNARKGAIINRIRVDQTLQATNRYYVLEHCTNTIEAFENAVWSGKVDSKGNDIRLDDGTTNIDTLDAHEYSIESLHGILVRRK